MKVALGSFASSGIEDHLSADIPAGVQAALFHYAGKMKTGRGLLDVPRFSPEQAFGETKAGVELELEVDEEIEAMLEIEAARQGVTIDQLVVHAVLIYLAELDFLTQPTVAGGPVVPA